MPQPSQPITLKDWSSGELAAGLACYRRGEFFAAHEHWELVWQPCREPERSFLQGLIQLAGAMHHHRRNNSRGAMALMQASLRRLDAYPERYGGLWLAPLRDELRQWLAELNRERTVLLPYPQIRQETAAAEPDQPAPAPEIAGPNAANRKI